MIYYLKEPSQKSRLTISNFICVIKTKTKLDMKQQQQMQQQYHQQNFCQQQKFRILFLVGVISLMATCAQADDYLKESPSFLQACKLSDPQNSECIAKAIENIFTNWKEGIPGLKNLGSVDPYYVKKVHLEQNNPNINIKLDAKDLVISGLSLTRVTKASTTNDYNFKVLLKVPKLKTKSAYRLKGTILFLRLNSTGLADAELDNGEVMLSMKAQLVKNKNQKFFDITSIKSKIKQIDNFYVHFGNLFNGNKELEDSANAVFNDNWRDLFEIMRPVLEETLDALIFERFKTIFAFVPANYFIEDLP